MNAGTAADERLGVVNDAMTRDVVVLDPEAFVSDAAMRLERMAVSGAPVVGAEGLVGMVSLSDLFRAVGIDPSQAKVTGPWHRYEGRLASSHLRVRDVMTRPVRSVPSRAPITEAAELMRTHGVNRIPVVTPDGLVVGIIARDDIVEAVARTRHLS